MVHRRASAPIIAVAALLLSSCSGPAAEPGRVPPHTAIAGEQARCRAAADCGDLSRAHRTASSPALTGVAEATALRAGARRFWVKDKTRYRSRWYAGAHRRMINFGCTRAPYYSPDLRCTRRRGFHHGLDIAMACGTRLFSALRGRVVNPDSAGSLGPAYGRNAFRIRNHRYRVDIVFGHTRKVYVRPGDRVRRGQLIAKASDMGAPDGCHLHFEVRPRRGSYQQAVNPRPRLKLRAVE